jgi:uncharacterized YigZ family protein
VINDDTYKTIEGSAEGLFKDKGSKFIAYIYPISSEEEVKEILQVIKKEHFSARHHCYAYRLGNFGHIYRANDDGEPSGTAGKPIYGQLLSNDLTNVLIVVVRYFGGTLLGVSGLINAYKNAAADAIQNAILITRIIEDQFLVTFDYPLQNVVMKMIKDEHLEIANSVFGLDCRLTLNVRLNKSDMMMKKFQSIYGVTIEKLNNE